MFLEEHFNAWRKVYSYLVVTADIINIDLSKKGKCVRGLLHIVTGNIKAHQALLNRVPEQATEDSVRYQIYY